jgi:hypothetical protein
MTREDDGDVVAAMRTQGARFTSTLTHATGSVEIQVHVRWIADPGDPSARTAAAYFVTPLRRMGATRLADEIVRTVGLPLLWEVVLGNRRQNGSVVVGVNAHRAAEIGNAPASL